MKRELLLTVLTILPVYLSSVKIVLLYSTEFTTYMYQCNKLLVANKQITLSLEFHHCSISFVPCWQYSYSHLKYPTKFKFGVLEYLLSLSLDSVNFSANHIAQIVNLSQNLDLDNFKNFKIESRNKHPITLKLFFCFRPMPRIIKL